MRLTTVAVETPVGEARRVCVADDAGLIDVTTAHAALLDERGEGAPVEVAEALTPPEMIAFLERGERALDAAEEAVAFALDGGPERGPAGGRLVLDPDESGVRPLAPVPRPNSLRDFMAFEEHVRNSLGGDVPDVWYEQPVYYKGNPDTVVGPGETVRWPAYSDTMDYELELAAVIGKRGVDVPVEAAAAYVAGYTVLNDFSARDAQLDEMRGKLGPAKGKDFASALGPYLVTPDEFDLPSAEMTAEIDGETVSSGTPGEMYHSFAELIAHVSQSEPLLPGDVLGSGTVGGGCGLEHGRFLEDGEEVALTVAGIGTLRNRVVRE
ncbi:fumarylacetoacetate hydrolase family protein [Halomarina halobia]|uniref:Fumarylacetoacetate hydrolase family protein n=1 Tax=Halomarina halobia TaxID=3033386 RepID=A0ABD6AAL7_9EURY|nr:fumarylacetoacetate hydrolase family protein [Halomarina sp. PSR21]